MDSKKISIIVPVPPNTKTVKTTESIKKAGWKNIELIESTGLQPSIQRNRAAEESTGKILYFLDSDVEVEKANLEKIFETFDDEKISAVGGPVLPAGSKNFLQKCFSIVFSSFFAMGSTQPRFAKIGKKRIAGEECLILANLAVKKSAFLELNGFNECLYPNEENEFLNRLLEKRHIAVYDPDISVSRMHKKNLSQFARAFFSYGRGRAEHFFQSPKFFKPFFLIPPIFTIYLFSTMLFFSNSPLFLIPLMAYIFIDLFYSVYKAIEFGFLPAVAAIALLYPMVHIFYGIGFIYGCTKTALKIGKKEYFNVELKKIRI